MDLNAHHINIISKGCILYWHKTIQSPTAKLKKSLKRDTDVQTSLKKISLLPLILFNGGVSRLQTQLSIRTQYYNVFIDILNLGHKERVRGLISRGFL